MPAFLITGNAGSGKSTVLSKLKSLGYDTTDADDKKYSHWVERSTGNSYRSRPEHAVDWVGKYDWLWKKDAIDSALAKAEDKIIIIGGSAHKIEDYFPLFKAIFLLHIDKDALVYRLKNRQDNDFGKRPGDIEKVLGWHDEYEQKVINAGAVIINSSRSIEKVVQDIIGELHKSEHDLLSEE